MITNLKEINILLKFLTEFNYEIVYYPFPDDKLFIYDVEEKDVQPYILEQMKNNKKQIIEAMKRRPISKEHLKVKDYVTKDEWEDLKLNTPALKTLYEILFIEGQHRIYEKLFNKIVCIPV